jgi:hypothetical protein
MTLQEDARVLLALVDRHLRALRLNLDSAYPDQEGPFPLRASRMGILAAIDRLLDDAVCRIGEG